MTSSKKPDEPAPDSQPDVNGSSDTDTAASQDSSDEVRRRAQELIEELHDRDPEKSKTIRGPS